MASNRFQTRSTGIEFWANHKHKWRFTIRIILPSRVGLSGQCLNMIFSLLFLTLKNTRSSVRPSSAPLVRPCISCGGGGGAFYGRFHYRRPYNHRHYIIVLVPPVILPPSGRLIIGGRLRQEDVSTRTCTGWCCRTTTTGNRSRTRRERGIPSIRGRRGRRTEETETFSPRAIIGNVVFIYKSTRVTRRYVRWLSQDLRL